jgi:hypothetical protein
VNPDLLEDFTDEFYPCRRQHNRYIRQSHKIQSHDLHERLRRNGYVNVRLLTLSHTYLSTCVRRTDSRLSIESLVLCWRQPFALFGFTPCTCVASVVGNERVYVYKSHAILCCRVRESLSKHWLFSCVQTSYTEFTTWRM